MPSKNRRSTRLPPTATSWSIDQKHWDDFVKNRKGSKDRIQRRTERELEIERRLKTPVLLQYQETPLSEVMDGLSELTGVNIHLDPRGLSQEGVNSDTPVTINLSKEISLKSALNLILEPLHLSYVDQRRSAEDHQRAASRRRNLPGHLQRGRPGDSDSELRAEQQHRFARADQRSACGGRPRHDRHRQLGPGRAGQRPRPATERGRQRPRSRAAVQCGAGGSGMSPSTVPIGAGPGGMGARRQRRLRFAHRPDRLHRFDRNVGRERRRRGRNPPVPHQPQPRHQPDAGRPRRNRRPARSSFAACRICRSRSKSASSGSTTASSSGSASTST